jgi:hypothetical protein
MSEGASKINVDVDALVKMARAVSPGDTITYAQMDECLGRPVQPRLYIWLQARERLAKDGILFDNVRNEGYRRLKTAEIPGVGDGARKKIRRVARKASRDMTEAVKRANDVPHDVQKAISAQISSLKLHEHLSSSAVQKKVEETVESDPLPLAKTMESLRQHLTG